MTADIIEADCVEAMRAMGEASVDAVVTDPPYGISFMGREFDTLGDGPRMYAVAGSSAVYSNAGLPILGRAEKERRCRL